MNLFTTFNYNSFIVCTLIVLLTSGPAFGQNDEEPIVPTSFPVSRYQEEWKNSAFHREVVARTAEKKIVPSFAASLRLEGLVIDSKGPIAYVLNTADNRTLVITKIKPKSEHSFQIVEANLEANPKETSITITNGVETAEIKYEASMLTAPVKASRPAATPTKKAATKISGVPPGPAPSGNASNKRPKPKPPAPGRKVLLPK